MTDSNPSSSAAAPTAKRGFFRDFIVSNIAYVSLLALALIGVAITNYATDLGLPYWQAMVPIFGIICIVTKWHHIEPARNNYIRLVLTQVLHWGAVFLVMRSLFTPDVQTLLDSDITGLILLYILALSTFLAGIYLDWRLGVVGLFLVASAYALAFIEEAALLLIALSVIIIIGFAFWHRLHAKILPQRVEA